MCVFVRVKKERERETVGMRPHAVHIHRAVDEIITSENDDRVPVGERERERRTIVFSPPIPGLMVMIFNHPFPVDCALLARNTQNIISRRLLLAHRSSSSGGGNGGGPSLLESYPSFPVPPLLYRPLCIYIYYIFLSIFQNNSFLSALTCLGLFVSCSSTIQVIYRTKHIFFYLFWFRRFRIEIE